MSVLQAQSELKAQACKPEVFELKTFVGNNFAQLPFQDPAIMFVGCVNSATHQIEADHWTLDDELLVAMEAREDAERGFNDRK